MLRKLITFFLATVFFVLSATASATQISDINTAVVSVTNRSQQALQLGLQQALDQVLIKMSGNTSIASVPAVQNATSDINSLVQSYHYSLQNTSSLPQLMLHVVFDGKAIKALLQNAGQSIWSDDRPLTLMWLKIVQNGRRVILSSNDDHNPLVKTIKQIAAQRSVPIIFPAMDLQDQANGAMIPMELPTQQQLAASARRYGVQSILVGSVTDDNKGRSQAEWKLLLKQTPYEWQSDATNLDQVITNGVSQAIDMMANQLAIVDSKNLQATVQMQVSGVANLDDYAAVVATLRHFTVVSAVTVNDMHNDTLLLEVATIGGVDALTKALQNVNHLVAETAPAEAGRKQVVLFYHWQGPQQQEQQAIPTSLSQPSMQTTDGRRHAANE